MANELSTFSNRVAPSETAKDEAAPRRSYRPIADIYEADGAVVVACEMPGVEPDGVEVTLERRELTIRGRIPETPRDGFRQIHAEYGEGDYERVFTVSEDFDGDAMKATYKNGVLLLELPVAAAAQPRRIEVKTA